jgi:hypothetical protein
VKNAGFTTAIQNVIPAQAGIQTEKLYRLKAILYLVWIIWFGFPPARE